MTFMSVTSTKCITAENGFNLEPLDEEPEDNENSLDDYDPHEHRVIQHPTSNWDTFIHFLKAAIGTGTLAMPMAFAHAGYINGLIFAILIVFIALHCMHIMIGSMYELCKRKRIPNLSYSEAMTVAFQEGPNFLKFFAPIAGPIVDGFLAFYHFGICCTYYVFIAENIKLFTDKYVTVLDLRIHMCILLIPLIFIYSIRNLQVLAPYSAVANFLFLVGLIAIFYYVFEGLPPISKRKAFVNILELPIFIGTTLFALESVGMVLAIEKNMKHPKSYTKPYGIMNIGMGILMVLFCNLGFFGYWKYGDAVRGSITLNLSQHALLAQHVRLMFAITFWISYALQGYVTIDIIWNKYLLKYVAVEKHKHYELLTRAVFVFLTFIFVILIPDLVVFVSLVGSFCLSILGIVFPALLQICVWHHFGYRLIDFRLIKNILLLLFGFIAFILGTYTSISKIVQFYKQ